MIPLNKDRWSMREKYHSTFEFPRSEPLDVILVAISLCGCRHKRRRDEIMTMKISTWFRLQKRGEFQPLLGRP